MVVDEAHLIESWGAEFRIEFQLLAAVLREWRAVAPGRNSRTPAVGHIRPVDTGDAEGVVRPADGASGKNTSSSTYGARFTTLRQRSWLSAEEQVPE